MLRVSSRAIVIFAGALLLAGCVGSAPPRATTTTATGSPTITAADISDPTINICDAEQDTPTVVIGSTLAFVRPADSDCMGLEPGTTQYFELTAHFGDAMAVAVSPEFVVGADGSYSSSLTVPADIPLGSATVSVLFDRSCGWNGTADCIFPSFSVDVALAPADLKPITVVEQGLPDVAARPSTSVDLRPYFTPGPDADQLTLSIPGSSCEAVPTSYDSTADPSSLDIVSVEDSSPFHVCYAVARSWTSVIDVPTPFDNYTTVTVNNVPAIPVD